MQADNRPLLLYLEWDVPCAVTNKLDEVFQFKKSIILMVSYMASSEIELLLEDSWSDLNNSTRSSTFKQMSVILTQSR